jgi:acyl-CoA synthetase (AMP-forming)/AMP-acid ligase II
MNHLDWLFDIFKQNAGRTFMVWGGLPITYSNLIRYIQYYKEKFIESGIKGGKVIALHGDYSPNNVAALLALVDDGNIVVPLASIKEEFIDIAEVQAICSFDEYGKIQLKWFPREVHHQLNLDIIASGNPGLILFSSGSTGKCKASMHDFLQVLNKFKIPRRQLVTLPFLKFDHMGGINTLFGVLSNAGTLVLSSNRDPEFVCSAIEKYRVELLPTSPTFLNLLLVSEAYQKYDLSSLKFISYGSEMMPQVTLLRIAELFPNVKLLQTYGLSEVGVLRSKSESSNSLWLKVGGEDFQTKVEDGILFIKANSAMKGYFNAPSPFVDGWMNTGDRVEVKGEYIRFLGRDSEIINVGGQKVYPAEVENVLLSMSNVCDVTVSAESNFLMGYIVVARFNLIDNEDFLSFKSRVREYCKSRLESFKIPTRIEIVEKELFNSRFKKIRFQEQM